MTTASDATGSNGFFSNLTNSLSAGLDKVASETLPTWIGNNLTGANSTNPTFNQNSSQVQNSSNLLGQAGQSLSQFPMGAVVLAVAGVLVTLVIIKVAKK